MTSKRTAEDEVEPRAPKHKRHKVNRIDPTSGQRGAFGDLGDTTTAPTGDSDLDCEDDSEALAYLRSVRIQASAIPHVLVAKKAGPPLPPRSEEGESEPGEHREIQSIDRTIYNDGIGDFRGYYEDGAYVAYADGHIAEEEGEKDTSECGSELDSSVSAEDRPHNSSADEIRDAYFASITTRYAALRKRLQTSPPRRALDALPASNPPEVGAWKRGLATFQVWEGRLRGTDPLPAQIAAMHKDSVFRLLRILLTTKFLRTGTQVRERTSRWLWALLARLPDKGELDYMEVGLVRELGKGAVLLMVSLAELEVLKEHYDVAGSSPEDQDEYEVDGDADDYFSDTTPGGDRPLDPVNAPTPEIVEDDNESALDSKASATKDRSFPAPRDTGKSAPESNNLYGRTPSHDEASDVEMQLSSDMEEGEVADGPPSLRSDHITDIEMAKARLLSQLNGDTADDGEVEGSHSLPASPMPAPHLEPATRPTITDTQGAPALTEAEADQEEGEYESDEDDRRYPEPDSVKVNERVTLNMILTVAGEFYGQRDLLEFRDPFGGL